MESEKKAFDLADLTARLKAKGLPDVEGLAKDVVSEVFNWVEDGIKATPTAIDDFALGLVGAAEKVILAKLDGIAP